MANFRVFNIGAANKEIDRLEAELTKTQAELVAVKENAAAVEANAAELSEKLSVAIHATVTAEAAATALIARAEKAEADLKAANDRLANPSEEIKVRASQEALKITAAQGQPPIPTAPSGAGAAGDILAQFEAISDSRARAQFFAKHKKEIYEANRNRKS